MQIVATSLMVMTRRIHFMMYHTDTHQFLTKGKISGFWADLGLKQSPLYMNTILAMDFWFKFPLLDGWNFSFHMFMNWAWVCSMENSGLQNHWNPHAFWLPFPGYMLTHVLMLSDNNVNLIITWKKLNGHRLHDMKSRAVHSPAVLQRKWLIKIFFLADLRLTFACQRISG